jgi:general secretion pathway protein A
MYMNFYGLRKQPFHITPDPEFLYLSPSHKEALAAIIYGIEQKKGFVTITGAVGVGKTTILRSYLDQADKTHLKIIYIFNSNLTFKELLETIYQELGIAVEGREIPEMMTELYDVLIEEYKKGNTVVLVVDEAQNMPMQTLESLRMISNLETSKDKLLQIVLVGQPEFEETLNLPTMRQLKQRVAIRSIILPLTRAESVEYIKFRLVKAGAHSFSVFTAGAIKLVVKTAKGIPRIINVLCDNALIAGFGLHKNPVKKAIVREIIRDYRGLPGRSFGRVLIPATAVAVLLVLAFGGAKYLGFLDKVKLPELRKYFPQSQEEQQEKTGYAGATAGPAGPSPEGHVEKAPSGHKPEPGMTTRKVVIGDTLSKMALETYGNSDVEVIKKIQKYNPEITNPDTIYLGSTIQLPAVLPDDQTIPESGETR